jgi:hypothetical protein
MLQSRLDPLYRPDKRRLSFWLVAPRAVGALLVMPDLLEALSSVVT